MGPKIKNWIITVSGISLGLWSFLTLLVYFQQRTLEKDYESLEQRLYSGFGTIQELIVKRGENHSSYMVSYSFNSDSGKAYVALESLDYERFKKLKLGDSLEIYHKERPIFGKWTAVSKIKGNPHPPPLFRNLVLLFVSGEIFLGCVFFGFLSTKVLGLLPQKDP